MQRILSAIIWSACGIIVVVWVPLLAIITLCTAPFDPGRYTAGRWFRRAGVLAVKLNPLWRFRASGYRPPDPRRPYLAISNHESYADIFLISHLPWEMKWVSKEAIFRIPLMGWLMRMAGDIELRRDDPDSRAAARREITDRLSKRVSVMVMPEGTRSRTGEMLPFQTGAFIIAIETGTPILPMAVAGTRDAMAKGSFRFNRATAEVRVLEPIETAGLDRADAADLRDRVRDLIARTRDELRRELAAETGDPAEGTG